MTLWRDINDRKVLTDHFQNPGRLYNLGAPIVATANYIVTLANMKVGAYTIAHQPDVARCVTVTHATVATGTDTLGTITVVGLNSKGKLVTEVITPVADTLVAGLTAFASIISITGAGWVIAGGNDTIIIGVGTTLGIPMDISSSYAMIAWVNNVLIAPTVVQNAHVEKCTVDVSSGTYNGSNKVMVLVSE